MVIKILKYQLSNLLRSKWIFFYTLFYFLLSYGLISLGSDSSKMAVSILNIILILIPLISTIYGTIFFYGNKGYIVFILSQPVNRTSIYFGLFLGIVISLNVSFIVGCFLPLILFNSFASLPSVYIYEIIASIFLSNFFVAIAFLVSAKFDDKLKGFGITIFIWLFLTILYDGLVLLILNYFYEYPLEKISLALSILNPVDLARIFIILKMDISALMGYTGAVFNDFFGGFTGQLISLFTLLMWSFISIYFSLRIFKKKDF